jgi:hypothetical protein
MIIQLDGEYINSDGNTAGKDYQMQLLIKEKLIKRDLIG